jgi:hypothetical protein
MVYSRNLKIYRGVDNRIDFQVRNGDQKKVNVTGKTVVFSLVSRETKDLVIKRDCSVDDETIGRVYVTITKDELLGIEEGNYDFSLIKETRVNIDSTGYQVTASEPLYIDSQYGAVGTIEIFGDVLGETYDTLEITQFNKIIDFNTRTSTNADDAPFDQPRPNYARHTPISGYKEEYVSGLIDGQPRSTIPQSLHTFQIQVSNYEGDVVVQASMDEGADPIEENWVDLMSWSLTSSDNDFYYNQIGKYNWFRVKHIPEDTNTGTVDKVLYR